MCANAKRDWPRTSTLKDGPAAGVTMTVALASLYADKPARSDTTMPGEITLTGLVLPVGGIKEKVLATHRSRMRRVVLPSRNEGDLKEVPGHVRSRLEFVFVDRIGDVLLATIAGLVSRNGPALAERKVAHATRGPVDGVVKLRR